MPRAHARNRYCGGNNVSRWYLRGLHQAQQSCVSCFGNVIRQKNTTVVAVHVLQSQFELVQRRHVGKAFAPDGHLEQTCVVAIQQYILRLHARRWGDVVEAAAFHATAINLNDDFRLQFVLARRSHAGQA